MSIIFYRDFEFLSFDFSLLFNVLLCEMDRCSDRSLSRDLLRFCVCLLLCFRGVLLRDRERPMFARFHISQNTRTHKQTRASANTPSTYNYNHTILVSNKFVFTAIKYICTKINSQGNIDIHFCNFARNDSLPFAIIYSACDNVWDVFSHHNRATVGAFSRITAYFTKL